MTVNGAKNEGPRMVLEMKEHGENLGTRALGQLVRNQITERLHSSSDRIVLDFAGVRVITQSFADEVFRKLLEELPKETVTRLAIRNASEDVRAVLRYASAPKPDPT
jgi:hypothetical protein